MHRKIHTVNFCFLEEKNECEEKLHVHLWLMQNEIGFARFEMILNGVIAAETNWRLPSNLFDLMLDRFFNTVVYRSFFLRFLLLLLPRVCAFFSSSSFNGKFDMIANFHHSMCHKTSVFLSVVLRSFFLSRLSLLSEFIFTHFFLYSDFVEWNWYIPNRVVCVSARAYERKKDGKIKTKI